MFKIAVLASTRGTDLQAIIDEMKAGKMPNIELSVVLGNRKSAYALQRAQEQGYKAIFVNPRHRTPEQFDARLVEILKKYNVDLVCLIGYMKILTPVFVRAFQGRIINVHPSLIPKYCGKQFFDANVHSAVIAAGESQSGMTIHYVTEEVDAGPIILQEKVALAPGETPESLREKVQALEKKAYPEVIRSIAGSMNR